MWETSVREYVGQTSFCLLLNCDEPNGCYHQFVFSFTKGGCSPSKMCKNYVAKKRESGALELIELTSQSSIWILSNNKGTSRNYLEHNNKTFQRTWKQCQQGCRLLSRPKAFYDIHFFVIMWEKGVLFQFICQKINNVLGWKPNFRQIFKLFCFLVLYAWIIGLFLLVFFMDNIPYYQHPL